MKNNGTILFVTILEVIVMNKVIIFSDSTCDLSKELIEEYDIKIIPLYVSFENKLYKDGIDMTTEQLYQKVEELDTLPKTSAVPPAEFFKAFSPYIEQGYDIVYTGIGSKISSTFNNAHVASLQFDENRVLLVDSLSLSTGIGLIVLKMAQFRDQGMSASQIKEEADKIVPKVHAQFAVPNLTFLHKGGRCSGTKRFFGTMLRIRPVIRLKNGILDLDDKAFGRFEKALDIMIQDIVDHEKELDLDHVMITHSFGYKEAEYIKEHLPEELKNKIHHLHETLAGCVISSHCGKRTIGILYITK